MEKIIINPYSSITDVADTIIKTMKSEECDNQDIKDAIIALSEIAKGNTKRRYNPSY